MILPWVRLHGVKDYADLPLQLSKYPSLPHTINVVPSLLAQLDAYAEGAVDEVLALTRRPASDLSDHERERIARHFIVLEQATMTADLPRFAVLVARIGSMGWHALSVGDWLDLQVLYTLAWTGPVHRTQQPVRGLIEKGAGYDEHDKMTLLAFHDSILQSIIPMMRRQRTAGHLELSVTPWNHPILPLLCNTDSARAAMPSAPLPQPAMVARRDAEVHVLRALDDAERRFGVRPEGMWPAEGSISNEALDVMVRAGVRWTASDEAVLRHSLGPLWTSTSALFPRRVITASGSIGVLFRDHDLSDAIGFTYASWEPDRAAQDFVRRLQDRRRRIVLEHGEEMLDHAIVPIMLDGENCWDFYPDNGSRFITALLTQLLDGDQFHVVTCGEATLPEHLQALPDVTSIVAGSWIDGTFDVWIGTPVKNLAWSLLRDARAKFESIESMLDERSAHQTFEHLLVAEGSDWFWWYDDHHQAPHKLTFDLLFRRRLQDAWRSMHLTPPSELDHPLYEAVMLHDNEPSRVAVTYGGSSMHESDLVAHDVRLEHSGDWQRVVLTLRRRPTQDESLTLTIASRDGQERACHITSDGLLWRSPLHDEGVHYLSDLEVAVYVHAGKEWHVRLEEERGAVRSFTTTLR